MKGFAIFLILGSANTVDTLAGFLDTYKSKSFYTLLARDWNQQAEKKLRNTFTIINEYSFPGVKLLHFKRNRDALK